MLPLQGRQWCHLLENHLLLQTWYDEMYWLWDLEPLCVLAFCMFPWGPPGSNAFCKCLLVLVLCSASLLRATLKLWGRGTQSLFWVWRQTHHDCLLQVHLVFSPRRDQLGRTPGTTGLPVLHLLGSSQYSIYTWQHFTWLYIAGLYLQWHRRGHHDRIRPSRRTGEADAKWHKYTSNFIISFQSLIPSTRLQAHRCGDQENGAMLPRAFKSVLFLDVFGWVSQKGQQWMNVLSCVIDLRGKKICCSQCWCLLADRAGNEEAWVFAYACVMLSQWWSWIEDNQCDIYIYADIISPWIFRNTRHSSNVNPAHQDQRCRSCACEAFTLRVETRVKMMFRSV